MSPAASVDIPDDLQSVRVALIEWYDANKRPIPWRDSRDPYAILIAEVMSQQTQIDRVGPAWDAFIDRWPSAADLTTEDLAEVIGFWSDHRLGYNRRAEYLHVAANQIVTEWDGEVPESPAELQRLKGVGPYTANAVASLAFNTGDAAVDTNVKRVLYRVLTGMQAADDPPFDTVANELMPPGASRTWNNAMMELGALVCTPTPACDSAPCPWRDWCAAYEAGDFTAPDVPSQSRFEGSRRQFRGRVVRALRADGPLELDELGHRIRVDYASDGEHGRDWLQQLLEDLADDGLIHVEKDLDRISVYLAGET